MRRLCAVVAGASSGIGYAVARELAGRGMDVVTSARRAEPLLDLARPRAVGSIEPFPADLTDPAQVGALFQHARSVNGSIDTVIHSVGHEYPVALLADSDPAAIPAAISALITSPALVLREALASLDPDRPGRVILVSSGAAFRALPGRALYGAAKAAVNQLVRSAATEAAARSQLAVAAILPGRVDTPMQRRLVTMARDADPSLGLSEFRSMEGVSKPEDVARAVGDLLDREPSELNGRIFRYAAGNWTVVE